MPVIVVTAPALADRSAELAALASIAAAVVAALGLQPEDAIARLVHSDVCADASGAVTGWPLAVLHGRRRDTALRAAAVQQVQAVLAGAWAVDPDRVWVQWSLAE